ncbi:MAG: lipopolysaccharide biosynthesis protein [candidate division KSB1 bacterium]|nr:lipopolysaccharide biosynthesis protein [candidate division KSB1 bacterium]MDZ7272770.1 lipopolysaccharide biosynthesis protein [candidate division KSB1 bacterium]MDZ7284206.1 lipopolysaccharide biosynthesis protein [candidate division KSB1 bacterium]MDZ7297396.1 lipopolysaccharide biosynthesis protein [candidate division KSB1 bacterium]MDZ7306544.1 lipopolysaccharide biosynthesis protein [candidate division KSB1 bacterium]
MSAKSKSIADQAKEGILYNAISRLSGTFFQFFASVALARMLAVEDFGVVQIATTIIGFTTKFGEFGFNMGLIQRREEVRPEHVNTLFVMDLSFKLILFGVLMLGLPLLVDYFHEPRLWTVMPAVAVYMVLDTFSNPSITLLKRHLNFKRDAQIDMIDRFLEIVTSVTFAAFGLGVWSLILSKWIATSTTAVLSARAAGWRPSLQFDFKASKELFHFGGWVFVRNLCREMADNVDYFFIGRHLNAQQLGYYAKAFDLMRLPQKRISQAFNSVLFSTFSRVQDQPEKVKAGLEKVLLTVSLASYPLLIGMMMVAPEFVRLVYGEKWLPMVLPLQIMCLAGILRSIDPFLNSVITATGYVKHTAYRRFIELGLLTVAVYIGVQYGIVGVSIAVVVVAFLVMFLMVSLLQRVSSTGWREYLLPQMPACAASLAMAAAILAFRHLFSGVLGAHSVWLLLGMIFTGAFTYVAVLWLWRPPQLVRLQEELSGDLARFAAKYRRKINALAGRLGLSSSAVE